MGWTELFQTSESPDGIKYWKGTDPDKLWCRLLPNHTSDLNAMHEAELRLSEEERRRYAAELVRLTNWNRAQDTTFKIARATARQRARALVRVIGGE